MRIDLICLTLRLMNIILASQSPRRLSLLQAAGFVVQLFPSHIDESALENESTQAMTLRLCQEKAAAYQYAQNELLPVIAADTLVAVDNHALGQPKDLIEAKRMIQTLSGKEHQVYTAVCVRLGEIYKSILVSTFVRFREIADAEIDVYLQHNDILDKAGGYAIQGGASSFITGIEGALDNVIGLPVWQTKLLVQEVLLEAAEPTEELVIGVES